MKQETKQFIALTILAIIMTIGFLTIATNRVDCLENHPAGQACHIGNNR